MTHNNHDDIHHHHHTSPPPQQSYSHPPQTTSFNTVSQQQDNNNQLKSYWCQEMESIEDLRSHQLPLSRIKKIMKSDRDVRMIAAEAPIVFAKACEMFIVDLTMRSWQHAEENKRRTLQKSDVSAAVSRNFAFDFLLDVVPRDESVSAVDPGFVTAVPHHDGGVQYYTYPVVGEGSGMYAPAQQMQAWPGAWTAVADDGEGEDEESGGNSGGN
ncbi:unnamed protein product [Cochlearia groenlandica]